ncbi:hypothetical protein [Aquabacter spiritensis]|uniref:Uncharacterized protein n=1 Tax=Aquabacter spiritensis TaxID=933073 RepID=A0A4R3M4E7_9HYPH|nr:hypothetical protein [Aquabacter spiritensis]TCT08100.1 hypothetical protein EDC64_101620 [Aquabacter spiritensis]
MSENVVSLRGTFHVEKAEPNPTVVGELERLLEAARSGELVGLAGVYLHKDKSVAYSYAGAVVGFGMIGGLECLKARLTHFALDQG